MDEANIRKVMIYALLKYEISIRMISSIKNVMFVKTVRIV